MKSFTVLYTVLYTVKKITNSKTGEVVTIQKVQKDGTKRVFFKPTIDGKAIGTTLWARLGHAESVASSYLNRTIATA